MQKFSVVTREEQSDTSSHAIDRRTFLGLSALALVSFGCSEDETIHSLPTTEHQSFDTILKELSKKYSVGASQNLGDKTVVVFADNHEPQYANNVIGRITETHQQFHYAFLQLEGYIDGPGSYQDKQASAEISRILGEKYTGSPSHNSLDMFRHGSYDSLFLLKDCIVQGMEGSPDSVVVGHLSSLVSDIYAFYFDKLKHQQEVILEKDGQATKEYSQLLAAHQYLQNRFDDFPKLPSNSFGKLYVEVFKKVRVLTRDDIPSISSLADNTDTWTSNHLLLSRSIRAAAKIVSLMKSSEAQCAAMSIGWLHTFDTELGPSVQHYLAKEGMSYIVVDLVDMKALRARNTSISPK